MTEHEIAQRLYELSKQEAVINRYTALREGHCLYGLHHIDSEDGSIQYVDSKKVSHLYFTNHGDPNHNCLYSMLFPNTGEIITPAHTRLYHFPST